MTHVLPLAAGAAVSPTILALSVLILSGPHGRVRQALVTTVNVGLMTLLAIVGTKLLTHVASHKGGGTHAATEGIYVTLGIVLLLLAVKEHFRPAKDSDEKPPAEEAVPKVGVSKYLSLGVVVTVTNFTTLALFIPALREISVAKVPGSDKVVAGAVLVAFATVTAWLPLVGTLLFPKPAARALNAIHNFTTTYKHQIVEVVLVGFGVYMVLKGFNAL